MDGKDIKKYLEEEYDIPFEVNKTFENGEPVFFVGPADEGKELFDIKISFQNGIRLNMDFIPRTYSASFIETMANQSEESKNRFLKYAQLLDSRGAKYNISVNGEKIRHDSKPDWPAKWSDLKIHVTKMPIVTEEELEHTEKAYEWGSIMMGMVLSLADIIPLDNEPPIHGYREGDAKRVEINRYERNPLNRKLCLLEKGYNCSVCGMNFEKQYGEIGKSYIHVHHIIPVSKMDEGYIVDTHKDLVPVCPNCHAMLHKTSPPLLPEELHKMMENL